MAKKKQIEGEVVNKFQEALQRLNKTYGEGSILTLNSKVHGEYDIISTGSIGFDHITLGVGGVVKGKLYELRGWEGCLAEDTYIKFINVRPDGIVQDCKGGKIKHLYNRFHNRNEKTKDTTFNVASINNDDRVFRNEIADVVKTGIKECFELKTKKGFSIQATKDHKFYTGTNYLPLSDLKVGDVVYVHTNTPYKAKEAAPRRKYKETTIKWYYKGKQKLINGCLYYREKVHRLIYEAHMNNISYDEYIKMLNTSTSLPQDFFTIPENYEIHHIDENTQNNDVENLMMILPSEHSKMHATERHNNLRFVVEEDEIISIESVGEKETYDIKCYFPYNNFIAEGIVVHNSGKSTICGHIVANCQEKGGKVLYIDGEHAVDKVYFSALGVNVDEMLIAQPSCGEEGFNIAMELINTGELDLVVIDSDSSLIPKKVLDGDVGDSSIGYKARLNSNAYPKLKSALSQHNVCVIVISQYREKIGVMFGNPTVTQGGHALKFYSDCIIEVSKTIAKEGDQAYGNITKVKAIKNKMSPPYKMTSFEIVYGVGIDKFEELMSLGSDYEVLRKRGDVVTYNENKFKYSEFQALLSDNPELEEEIIKSILERIKNNEKPTENDGL
jgi:recombination protein RecA